MQSSRLLRPTLQYGLQYRFVSSLERHRSSIVQALSPWIRSDPSWKQATLDALRVRHHDDAHFYNDSIESFLKDFPNTHGTFLDKMAASTGFDNHKTAKKYRRAKRRQNDAGVAVHQSQRKILSLQQKMERLEKPWNDILKNVEDWKHEIEAMEEAMNQKQETSAMEDVWGSLTKMMGYVKAKSEEELKQENFQRKKIRKLRNKVDRNESKAHKLRRDIDRARQRIEAEEALKLDNEALLKQKPSRIDRALDEAREVVAQAFSAHIQERHAALLERYQELDSKTDLTRPQEWFLYARLYHRKIIFHGGPTNSGKTYNALERLKEAKRGLYVGPLRLLAAEVYEKLTASGIYCNLFTGQEIRDVPFATHTAATIEMASTAQEYDVVVIDEIQMVASAERGYAWTRAFMGMRCKEIHVCGGLEATEIVQKLAKACGDDYELNTYKRFSALTVEDESLASFVEEEGSFSSIQPGDCIVAFSRDDIFAIKREIEKTTKLKCCVIYGSLPPKTRSHQARLFNDPNSEYDVLVASDAIGMGLNLSIRRIIFNSIYKNDGHSIIKLDHSAIKQIGGRAGRRNSLYPEGLITCRDPRDLEYIRECINTDIDSIPKAGLLPTASHIERFSDTLDEHGIESNGTNLHEVMSHFSDMATVKSDFFLCRQEEMKQVAELLTDANLSIVSRSRSCMQLRAQL